MKIIKELLGKENKKTLVFLKCDEQKKDTSSDIDAVLNCDFGVVDIKYNGECFFHYISETKDEEEDINFVRIYIDFYDSLSYDDVKDFFEAYEIIFQRIVNGLDANPDSFSKYTKQAIDMLKMLAVYPKEKELLEIAIEKLVAGKLGRVENTNYHVVEKNKGTRQLVYVSTCLDDTRINKVVEFDVKSHLLTTDEQYVRQIGKYYKFSNFDEKYVFYK